MYSIGMNCWGNLCCKFSIEINLMFVIIKKRKPLPLIWSLLCFCDTNWKILFINNMIFVWLLLWSMILQWKNVALEHAWVEKERWLENSFFLYIKLLESLEDVSSIIKCRKKKYDCKNNKIHHRQVENSVIFFCKTNTKKDQRIFYSIFYSVIFNEISKHLNVILYFIYILFCDIFNVRFSIKNWNYFLWDFSAIAITAFLLFLFNYLLQTGDLWLMSIVLNVLWTHFRT